MRAIHKAKKLIESAPGSEEGLVLGELVMSLEAEQAFDLRKIYKLDYRHFELALAVIADWRLDRYYASKFRLINAALHAQSLNEH